MDLERGATKSLIKPKLSERFFSEPANHDSKISDNQLFVVKFPKEKTHSIFGHFSYPIPMIPQSPAPIQNANCFLSPSRRLWLFQDLGWSPRARRLQRTGARIPMFQGPLCRHLSRGRQHVFSRRKTEYVFCCWSSNDCTSSSFCGQSLYLQFSLNSETGKNLYLQEVVIFCPTSPMNVSLYWKLLQIGERSVCS